MVDFSLPGYDGFTEYFPANIQLRMTASEFMYSIYTFMSLVVRKPFFGGFDQVLHKPGCTVTEDVKRHEILDLESRGIVLSV